MKNPTAQQWYDRAYKLHYKLKDYKEAYASYLLVAKCFNKSSEAKYAEQQMENIRQLSVYSHEFDQYADSFTGAYYDIDQMMIDVIERVGKGMDSFPKNNLVECNLAILSKDDECLYYCGYGKLNEQLDSVINALDIEGKIAVTKELIDNILVNDPVYVIPLENVVYFKDKGDVSYSTSISGGGGGSKGVNIGGAIAGKMMFGDVGALIGSKAGTGIHIDEIRSETVEHDNRYVILRYIDSDKKYCDIQLEYDCYDALNKLIPDKEYSHVSLNGVKATLPIENIPKQVDANEIPVNQLRQLKTLLDEGIITREDFDAKKKKLLGI